MDKSIKRTFSLLLFFLLSAAKELQETLYQVGILHSIIRYNELFSLCLHLCEQLHLHFFKRFIIHVLESCLLNEILHPCLPHLTELGTTLVYFRLRVVQSVYHLLDHGVVSGHLCSICLVSSCRIDAIGVSAGEGLVLVEA